MKKISKKPLFTVITTLCLVVVTFFAVNGCDKSEISPKTDSNVNFTPCQQSELRSSSELSNKVDVEFTGKGVQITYYNFEVTCDFTTVNVTHTLVNGVLNITQQGFPNQAKCTCYTDVSYTIEGISQNEVNVIFINGVQVYCYNENNNCEWIELKPVVLTEQLKNDLDIIFSENNELVKNIKGDTLLYAINSKEELLEISYNINTVIDINFENQSIIWGRFLTSSISNNIASKQLSVCYISSKYRYEISVEKCTDCWEALGYLYYWAIYPRKININNVSLVINELKN